MTVNDQGELTGAEAEASVVPLSALDTRQFFLRFFHEEQGHWARATSYEIRQALKHVMPDWPFLEVTLRTGRNSFVMVSNTPEAGHWMREHMGRVMTVVADLFGRMLAVEFEHEQPWVDFGCYWEYVVPRLIVARDGRGVDWRIWREAGLAEEQRAEMTLMLKQGIEKRLLGLRGLPADTGSTGLSGSSQGLPGLELISPGRPMPITPPRQPQGMARLDVVFRAPWRLHGHFHVGIHPLLGYGQVIASCDLKAAASRRGQSQVDSTGQGPSSSTITLG